MDNAYYMPGAVSKVFININSFTPLKDPMKLVLLLSLFIDEETEAQGCYVSCLESQRCWVWRFL